MSKNYNYKNNEKDSEEKEVFVTPIDGEQPVNNSAEGVEIPEPVFGKVANCNRLNVRTEPTTESDVITVLDKGTEVKIIAELPDWCQVETVNENIPIYAGFCMKQYIVRA